MKTPDYNRSPQTVPERHTIPGHFPCLPKRLTALAFALFILATGCATSTHKVTGSLRPPVDPDSVTVYHSMPAHAQIIGTITADSYHGITLAQADADVLTTLKKEAGRMGANGVVLSNVDDKPLDGARGGAKAIFVSR